MVSGSRDTYKGGIAFGSRWWNAVNVRRIVDMRWPRTVSIGKELTRMSFVATLTALILAGSAFIGIELVMSTQVLTNELRVMAVTLSANSAAAVVFDDRISAEETLSSLNRVPNIVYAEILRPDGTLFARYVRSGATIEHRPAVTPTQEGKWFGWNRLSVSKPFGLTKEPVGIIVIQSDLGPLFSRLWNFGSFILVSVVLSLAAAYFVFSRLHTLITGPILRLAATMQNVSQSKDYSVRATPVVANEIGRLINGFNDMLSEIQRRDSELATQTTRVEETNIRLNEELEERLRVEKELRMHQEELRELAYALVLAEERERRNIAVVLHDNVGQMLILLKMKLQEIRASVTLPDLEGVLDEMVTQTGKAIQYSRSLTAELSPPVLYELGLEAAVRWFAGEFGKRHAISIDFKDDDQVKEVNHEVSVLLFRAVQELLMNVVKHAQARNVVVTMARVEENLHITVADDGIGFDATPSRGVQETYHGFGLFNIRERLGHLQGSLEVASQPGRGTVVKVVLPLNGETGKDWRKEAT
jgi:signal transduction histidine kinase